MGFIGELERVNNFSRKQCKSLFWRVKAAVKKAVKNGGKKQQQQFKFQYDPSSYALNFDDGCCHLGGGAGGFAIKHASNQDGKNTLFVYVIWVES
ncbi:hypothetical protein Tsubulata_019862 [Turnera subulata]|uniref:Uncharacterized protein n=1 Tax=Turnera subulata TaxID=218843 RepID=A0A9Q0GJX4_9ROSI|nr:hypothetical protein Tsubulata_019862 [Turnera subulata]